MTLEFWAGLSVGFVLGVVLTLKLSKYAINQWRKGKS
jgi:hypothetical protein